MGVQILLADHHRIVREGVRRILETRDDFEVTAEAADGAETLRLASEKQPEVVVLEIAMPGMSGFDVIRQLAESDADTRCVVLSSHQSSGPVEEALRAGAAGYVPKSVAPSELLEAVEAVAAGRSYLSPTITRHVVAAVTRPGESPASAISLLTNRERDVLRLIAEGLRSKEIAKKLNLTVKTIETHRANLMAKLGIHNAASLVRFAIREGLIAP